MYRRNRRYPFLHHYCKFPISPLWTIRIKEFPIREPYSKEYELTYFLTAVIVFIQNEYLLVEIAVTESLYP